MNKTEMVEMMRGFMASDAVEILSTRCIYENQDLIVEHTVMDFADGTRSSWVNKTQGRPDVRNRDRRNAHRNKARPKASTRWLSSDYV